MKHVVLTVAVLSMVGLLADPVPAAGGRAEASRPQKKEPKNREPAKPSRPDNRNRGLESLFRGQGPTSLPTSQPTTAPAEAEPPTASNRRRTDGEKARDVLKQQERALKALRDAALNADDEYGEVLPPPPTPAEQLAEAQRRLDDENARHDARLAELRREEDAARAAGNRKRVQAVRKSIEQENTAYNRSVAELRRQVRECQARLDAETVE